MANSNDGIGYQGEFYPRLPGQDKKYFRLGTSPARPARGYWAARAGVSKDYDIEEAIAGLSDPEEIKAALIKLGGWDFAYAYMTYFKMGWTW